MAKLVGYLKDFTADEVGATIVEYSILGGLAASLMILALLGVSDSLGAAWGYLTGALPAETPFTN